MRQSKNISASPSEPLRILTEDEIAAQTGISLSTLRKMRVTGDGPPYVKLGRRVGYLESSFRNWVLARERRSTSDVYGSVGR